MGPRHYGKRRIHEEDVRCPECGTKMVAMENNEYYCPMCAALDDDVPDCCTSCGGDYPNCVDSCPIFDD